MGTTGAAGDAITRTWARRLRLLRPFMRWLQQFEPATEVPDDAIFGPIPGGRRRTSTATRRSSRCWPRRAGLGPPARPARRGHTRRCSV